MRPALLLVAGLTGALAAGAVAQDEPPTLELPAGVRVRIRTQSAPGAWIKGVLASADSGAIALVPEGAPPLGPNQLRLPRDSVTRLEIVTGTERHWLRGLVIGAALGVAMGFAVDVDPVRCEFDDNYACSRGEAVGLVGGFSAVVGAGIGGMVRKDVWTPVGLDALGPPPARVGRTGLALRAVAGGASLDLSVRF
jgi:hypothetical protein